MRDDHRKKLARTGVSLLGSSLVLLATWGGSSVALANTNPIQNTIQNKVATEPTETVMVVGGSVAHGWADPTRDSYIRRSFAMLSESTHVNYQYDDQSIPGCPAVRISSTTFQNWLNQDQPNVVIISWGILDDIHNHTPLADFQTTIHDEIAASLQHQAVVFVVTPPVVPANADKWHSLFEQYVSAERAAANSFSSPNVHFVPLNRDMASYMQMKSLSLSNYAVGGWHPNAAGHELAGILLDKAMVQMLGSRPIEFVRKGSEWKHGFTSAIRGAGRASLTF